MPSAQEGDLSQADRPLNLKYNTALRIANNIVEIDEEFTSLPPEQWQEGKLYRRLTDHWGFEWNEIQAQWVMT